MATNLHSWTFYEKFAVRFFAVLFIWYILPFPVDLLPFLSTGWSATWKALIPWIGAHILHLDHPITIFPNGSGDTTYSYVLLLTQFVGSLLAAIVWSLLDKRRSSYQHLHYWLRVLVRYFLGYNMLVYGFVKVFHLQMPAPSLGQLMQPLGDKSPMGLAWTYMGFSPAYSAFTGWAEVIAGLLLFWRRTTTLGAMLSVAVCMNIVAVNMCFDVPVKLFSSMLLLMSFFLLAPDIKRLADMLVRNKAVAPKEYPDYIGKRWLRLTLIVFKCLYLVYILEDNIATGLWNVNRHGDKAVKPPLYGIYDAQLMMRGHDTVLPLTTSSYCWKTLIIQSHKHATVKTTNDSLRYYAFRVDTVAKKAVLFEYADTTLKYTLAYQLKGKELELSGKLFQDTVLIRLTKRDLNSFRLTSRGFHWINEYPYNR